MKELDEFAGVLTALVIPGTNLMDFDECLIEKDIGSGIDVRAHKLNKDVFSTGEEWTPQFTIYFSDFDILVEPGQTIVFIYCDKKPENGVRRAYEVGRAFILR